MEIPLNRQRVGGGRPSLHVLVGLRAGEAAVKEARENPEGWLLCSSIAFVWDRLADAHPTLFTRVNHPGKAFLSCTQQQTVRAGSPGLSESILL